MGLWACLYTPSDFSGFYQSPLYLLVYIKVAISKCINLLDFEDHNYFHVKHTLTGQLETPVTFLFHSLLIESSLSML